MKVHSLYGLLMLTQTFNVSLSFWLSLFALIYLTSSHLVMAICFQSIFRGESQNYFYHFYYLIKVFEVRLMKSFFLCVCVV